MQTIPEPKIFFLNVLDQKMKAGCLNLTHNTILLGEKWRTFKSEEYCFVAFIDAYYNQRL